MTSCIYKINFKKARKIIAKEQNLPKRDKKLEIKWHKLNNYTKRKTYCFEHLEIKNSDLFSISCFLESPKFSKVIPLKPPLRKERFKVISLGYIPPLTPLYRRGEFAVR